MSRARLLARLEAARQRKRIAEECCPHWDYDSDGDGGHICCHEYEDARAAVKAARKAVDRAGGEVVPA